MTDSERIRGLLKSIAGEKAATIMIAEVVEIDEENAIIKAQLDEDLELEEIRLRSIIDGDNGMYVIPEVGSVVLLVRIGEDEDFMVIGCEKYNKVVIKGEEISLVISQENIIFNGNRLDSFLPDINKLVDKINKLEQQVNDLKDVFTNWTPVAQDGGAKLKLGVTSWASQKITETTKDDIKDEKILN